MKHLMIDLETYGTLPGSVIRSFGAVIFDPHSDEMGNRFYANIRTEEQIALGCTIDPETERWWARQSEAARASLDDNKESIRDVITKFNQYWFDNRPVYVWSQGSNFDVVLWEDVVFKAMGRVMWKFYNTRDTRTMYDACKVNIKAMGREGTYHNALADAEHQARCVQACYAKLNKIERT